MIFINLNNIKPGMTIKNYKELCTLLDEPIKAGKGKKYQLIDFERYFECTKEGHKYIITKIFDEPKPKADHKIYGQYIEKLILDLLIQQQEINKKKTVYFSTCKLLEVLKMVNQNYSYGMDNKPKLAYFLNMDKEYIKDFYNTSYSKLVGVLEDTLKRLYNKMLISYGRVITVVLKEYDIDSKYKENHITANNIYDEYIGEVEKRIAKELGCDTRNDIIIQDKWKEFNKKVIETLREELDENIIYYYRSYRISFNKYIMEEQQQLELILKDAERLSTQDQLNNTIIDNYKISNDIRYQKNKKKYNKFNEPKFKSQEIKISDEYIKNNNELVDTLINHEYKNITTQVHEKYKDKEKERIENEKLLDELFS